jgi:hypothetical protein
MSEGKLPLVKKCAQCNDEVGYLMIAGVAIEYGDMVFCSEVCLEEWLDECQDDQCPKCGMVRWQATMRIDQQRSACICGYIWPNVLATDKEGRS